MSEPIRYTLWLNPEPWAVGTISSGRKNGKIFSRISPDPNLAAFQRAVKEELIGVPMLPSDYTKITFFFWRQQAVYLDSLDRRRHRNQADATNMQKGLEDALQGILFENDRDVQDIRSVIIEQGLNITPCIVIQAERFSSEKIYQEISGYMYDMLHKRTQVEQSSNEWPPRS